MNHINKLDVYISDKEVGTLALYKKYVVAFQYTNWWLQNGFALDPFHLPLINKLFISEFEPFNGLFGVFNDSLPDGWGCLLIDRMLKQYSTSIDSMNPLDLLAIIGNTGKGALEYRPANKLSNLNKSLDLDLLAKQAVNIFETKSNDGLLDVFNVGASSGGARPKALIEINDEEWIVKFPCSLDPKNIAQMEFDYCKCAEVCEIEVPETKLISSNSHGHIFAIKRFDRFSNSKIHMVSLSSLLNTSYRIPALDYDSILKLTWNLTKNIEDVKEIYKRMCFNVFAHNRDDHSNNFSFLYIENKWKPSPAYDLTFSNSLNGEHATTINGEGQNPSIKNILQIAEKSSIPLNWAKETALNIQSIVTNNLSEYLF